MKIAVMGDIHANYRALAAVLADEAFRSADRRYCLGDIVGFGLQPDECVKRIKLENIPIVQGDHDSNTAHDVPCIGGIEKASYELTKELITRESVIYLERMHKVLLDKVGGRKVMLVHGSPDFPLTGARYEKDLVRVPKGIDILLMGHTHIPFIRHEGDCLIVNPGSVGRPGDGDLRPSFALIDTTDMSAVIMRVKQVVR